MDSQAARNLSSMSFNSFEKSERWGEPSKNLTWDSRDRVSV